MCPSVFVCVRVFIFEIPVKRLFAPTFRSQMSKNLRDSESLGKSSGRSGLNFEHFCSKNVLKLLRQKRFSYHFFRHLFTFEVPFKRLFAPTTQTRMSKIFGDSESLGKNIGKKWSQI